MGLDKDILHCKARLAELKSRDKKIERQAEVHFVFLRELLDPYKFDEDYTSIDNDRVQTHAEELARLCGEGRRVREQIRKLEHDLNG